MVDGPQHKSVLSGLRMSEPAGEAAAMQVDMIQTLGLIDFFFNKVRFVNMTVKG